MRIRPGTGLKEFFSVPGLTGTESGDVIGFAAVQCFAAEKRMDDQLLNAVSLHTRFDISGIDVNCQQRSRA